MLIWCPTVVSQHLSKNDKRGWLTRWPPRSFANPIWHSAPLCLHWSTMVPLCFHLLYCSLTIDLLYAMAFMMLLLVGWAIWNNKPLTIDQNVQTRKAYLKDCSHNGLWITHIGLLIHLTQEKVRKRISKQGNLLYDLCAPQSYLIPSNRCTFYLRIKEISVIGKGYILFKQKLDTKIRKGKRKAIVRNTKLYVPISSDFYGIIDVDQQLGSPKIIPLKNSIMKLYHFDNSDTVSPRTVGVYNGKISAIAKKNSHDNISKFQLLRQNITWLVHINEVESDVL